MTSQTEQLKALMLSQGPTEQQVNAIFADDLEFLLRASPGSGKTWTSCRRFIWRGANWHHKAGGLALLSFTNTAIREFHEETIRVGRLDLLSFPNYLGTFDSFIERFIIAPFGHLVTESGKRLRFFIGPRVGDRSNKRLAVWTEMGGGKRYQVSAWEIIPALEGEKVVFRASSAGSTLTLDKSNPVHELFQLGYYTHAQRLYLAWKILLDRPHVARCLARRFPEIIVDEAQDTNSWLLKILDLLRQNGTKVTLVGDPDQCIYEFNMADPTLLPDLKTKWGIPEKPLSRSFRCNNRIATSARHMSGHKGFEGSGEPINDHCQCYIFREDETDFKGSISSFEAILRSAGVSQDNSTILCRGKAQLESIRGISNYTRLKGKTHELALAAFHRDVRNDYKKAFQIVEKVIREIVDEPDLWDALEEDRESPISSRFRVALWKFTKSRERLPFIEEKGARWIEQLKVNLAALFEEIEIKNKPTLGHKIKKTGLNQKQLDLPLFQPQTPLPAIRQETIHQVKGESLDAVLLLGTTHFFNSVAKAILKGENSETRRLAYVAMTRARHLVVVALPASHYDKHSTSWVDWGFNVIGKNGETTKTIRA